MIGKAVLSLLDLDEEYVANFPSAYGRSILTLPWFEMGGEITISCAKTGYNANIEFLTKVIWNLKEYLQFMRSINTLSSILLSSLFMEVRSIKFKVLFLDRTRKLYIH